MEDPVCGMRVDEENKAPSSMYQGQKYFFCSEDCKLAFDDDPERYLSWGGDARVQGFA